MVKRLVDIDDAAVDRVRRVLGTGTMKDTVDRALEAVITSSLAIVGTAEDRREGAGRGGSGR